MPFLVAQKQATGNIRAYLASDDIFHEVVNDGSRMEQFIELDAETISSRLEANYTYLGGYTSLSRPYLVLIIGIKAP